MSVAFNTILRNKRVLRSYIPPKENYKKKINKRWQALTVHVGFTGKLSNVYQLPVAPRHADEL